MTEPTPVPRDVIDRLRRGEHVELGPVEPDDDGTFGFWAVALVSGRTNASATATYYARLLEKPELEHPREHRFELEDLLAVLIASEDDVDDDFRAWLLGTLPPILRSGAGYLAVWAEDRVGDGAWLGAIVDGPEHVLELAEELGGALTFRLIDVGQARARLEEVLPC